MATETIPKQYFIYNLLELNKDGHKVFAAPVRLKLYINDTKLYINEIILNTATLELCINGDAFGQYVIDLFKWDKDITYEFDY